jgi:hypothetical protein
MSPGLGEEKNLFSCWESNHGSSWTFSLLSLHYSDSGSKTKFKAYKRNPLTTLLLHISQHETALPPRSKTVSVS